ncbi:hypothetical protein AMS68_007851 [Peltaster fructicola]|uniref:Uncharacterized protein n=1 Tax=Peltaster fructicola TaxID=286661 RepID=A0A6H0Y5P0_9PEZI|nr:hypothetical protein AMS68_007851 [Peltaster fructicola]
MTFNEDGTGELLAVGDMGTGWLFTTSTRWRIISTVTLADDMINTEPFKKIQHINRLTRRPELIGALKLEITVEKVVPEKAHWPSVSELKANNTRMLSEAAYSSRQFIVIIERGNFSAVQDDQGWRGLRMTFDKSPYPTLEGYNHDEGKGGPPRDWLYEWLNESNSFYAGKPAASLAHTRATEDDTVLGYHTSKCIVS